MQWAWIVVSNVYHTFFACEVELAILEEGNHIAVTWCNMMKFCLWTIKDHSFVNNNISQFELKYSLKQSFKVQSAPANSHG